MKTDKQKRIEYLESQIQTMQDTVERLKKEEDAERSEFDFKSKMPVGSAWLGNLTVNSWHGRSITFVRQFDEDMAPVVYHAHQIVKMAQECKKDSELNSWSPAMSIKLIKVLEAAERDGVLQNLE